MNYIALKYNKNELAKRCAGLMYRHKGLGWCTSFLIRKYGAAGLYELVYQIRKENGGHGFVLRVTRSRNLSEVATLSNYIRNTYDWYYGNSRS